jgi:hypothetical protein
MKTAPAVNRRTDQNPLTGSPLLPQEDVAPIKGAKQVARQKTRAPPPGLLDHCAFPQVVCRKAIIPFPHRLGKPHGLIANFMLACFSKAMVQTIPLNRALDVCWLPASRGRVPGIRSNYDFWIQYSALRR